MGKCDGSVFRQEEKAYAQFIRFSKGHNQRGPGCSRVNTPFPPNTHTLFLPSHVSSVQFRTGSSISLSIITVPFSFSDSAVLLITTPSLCLHFYFASCISYLNMHAQFSNLKHIQSQNHQRIIDWFLLVFPAVPDHSHDVGSG